MLFRGWWEVIYMESNRSLLRPVVEYLFRERDSRLASVLCHFDERLRMPIAFPRESDTKCMEESMEAIKLLLHKGVV
jgi:hypothetical protein